MMTGILRLGRRTVTLAIVVLGFTACSSLGGRSTRSLQVYVLDYDTPADPTMQSWLNGVDEKLRQRLGMSSEHAAVGVLDLRTLRLAMIHPDRIEYAASVAKIGILLAYFELHPEAAKSLDNKMHHELGLMVKASNNEVAAKFSRELGLTNIQAVLNKHGLYDREHGGGIWVGKHYGPGNERIGDPIGGHSHAVTVRQLLRFYLLLEQGKLVSPQASQAMREIFASPKIPHDNIKFVKALAGRDVHLLRKWGSWRTWQHDTAVISGPDRHYILVALTNHPRGDDYLAKLATEVDDLFARGAK
ncbi:MAG TPA: serine hydrolase [Candidatus Acidoferrum sp.]|nr:serine hydrolase [Candidatus Acidoferrum sp.]